MKQIAFASGKGGAGKTSVATAFFNYLKKSKILADCDVDASNCFITMEEKKLSSEEFYSGKKYSIIEKECIGCGMCIKQCDFGAIKKNSKKYRIIDIKCEGCGSCFEVCPNKAIDEHSNYCGNLYLSTTHDNSKLYYAKLFPGEDNSGKLIHDLKQKAVSFSKTNDREYLIIDAPPGIGCPAIASLVGVNILIIVLEATQSGFHDAKNLIELSKTKKIKTFALINKSGINQIFEDEIKEFLEKENIELVGEIPFNKEVAKILKEKKLITDISDTGFNENIISILENILEKGEKI
ncbi:MAG TPA: ATP-binding protein [Spirochaetota bacterium]|nr:ATP-binding protein [Spirochaetota bacterium]